MPAETPAEPEKNVIPEPAKKQPSVKPAPAPQKKQAKKQGKEELLKKFIATKLIRDDTGDAAVSKEELYGIFSRWCREQKAGTVPDTREVTVALKTRFAFEEKSISGVPGWAHVRLK